MTNSNVLTVRPTRSYVVKSEASALTLWNSGIDFVIADVNHLNYGALVNKADVADPTLPRVKWVNIRFNNDRDVCVIEVTK